MTPRKFMFEGESLTASQIRQRVPILSDATIRAHLAAGRNTASAMLTFDGAARSRAGGAAAAKRAKARGHNTLALRRKATA